jgi:hypothetical protein
MRHAWSEADEDEQRKQWGAERQHAHGAVAMTESCGEDSGSAAAQGLCCAASCSLGWVEAAGAAQLTAELRLETSNEETVS